MIDTPKRYLTDVLSPSFVIGSFMTRFSPFTPCGRPSKEEGLNGYFDLSFADSCPWLRCDVFDYTDSGESTVENLEGPFCHFRDGFTVNIFMLQKRFWHKSV